MKTCKNCKYSEPIMGGLACMGRKGMPFVRPTDSCDSWKTMKKTNYDRLISRTPEVLAVICEDGCPPTPGSPICASVEVIEGETVKEHCQRCWLNWLKSPVEVEE